MKSKTWIILIGTALALALAACGGGGTTTVTVQGGEEETAAPSETTAAEETQGTEANGEVVGPEFVEISRDEWLALKLGSTRQEVIEALGPATRESGLGSGLVSLFYSLAQPNTTISIAIDEGALASKKWIEEFGGPPISPATFKKAKPGMSEKQVKAALGVPYERDDEYTTYSIPAMGENPPGTLQRCLIYRAPARLEYAYEICFGTDGRVNWTYPPGS